MDALGYVLTVDVDTVHKIMMIMVVKTLQVIYNCTC